MNYELSNYSSFYSIVKELEKVFSVEVLWVVENGGYNLKRYQDGINVYNVFSYKNYNEIIDELKPDIVMTIHGDQGYLERSLLRASLYAGIPSVDIISSVIELNYFRRKISLGILMARLNAIRDHGRILVKKYLFLLRTLYSANYGIKFIITMIIKDMYVPLITFIPRYNYGGADLNIVNNSDWVNLIVEK
jgi:hypothetical protein